MVIAVNRMKIDKSIIFFQDWVHSVIFDHGAEHEDHGGDKWMRYDHFDDFYLYLYHDSIMNIFSVGFTP